MPAAVSKLVERYYPSFPARHCGRIFTDTTEFMAIRYGDVIELDGQHYLVLKDEAERRFGIEDPKFWVKRCRALETEDFRILKLVFYERFHQRFGEYEVLTYRSPIKESRILELTSGDPRFMQGVTVEDEAGNPVRIIKAVNGRQLNKVVERVDVDHETYFREHFPRLLAHFIDACEAIDYLHQLGEKHGDIRRDHLYMEFGTGKPCWIDFDYTFESTVNPFGLDIFGLGNILVFLAGKGVYTPTEFAAGLKLRRPPERGDFSLVLRNRLVNLRLAFPHIPERLNRVMMHFSLGTEVFYESVGEFLDDLRPCLDIVSGN